MQENSKEFCGDYTPWLQSSFEILLTNLKLIQKQA